MRTEYRREAFDELGAESRGLQYRKLKAFEESSGGRRPRRGRNGRRRSWDGRAASSS